MAAELNKEVINFRKTIILRKGLCHHDWGVLLCKLCHTLVEEIVLVDSLGETVIVKNYVGTML